MFFQCTNKKVIEANVRMTNAYQHREDAEQNIFDRAIRKEWEPKDKPVPVETVEGFYLVHESLFEEILKKHT
ncbi:hypothetical protein [Pedobacter jejuensis]|nr:hypothetical protein [Pedobacter jejuensis]